MRVEGQERTSTICPLKISSAFWISGSFLKSSLLNGTVADFSLVGVAAGFVADAAVAATSCDVGTAAVLQLPGAIVRSVSDSSAVTAAVPVDAIDLTATEDSEPVIDLSAEASVAREPVPASASLPSGLDETDAGLPRRRPADPSNGGTDSSGDIAAPPSRPAEAVFELVARFEAGRRRAQTDEPNDEGDAS